MMYMNLALNAFTEPICIYVIYIYVGMVYVYIIPVYEMNDGKVLQKKYLNYDIEL